MVSDGLDDVSVMLNATPKSMEGQIATDKLLFSLGGGILCAKASMLLQVVDCFHVQYTYFLHSVHFEESEIVIGNVFSHDVV